MIASATTECAYCGSPIAPGQRWVRQKIYDHGLNGREPHYQRYHAEPSAGQSESCWDKHRMEQELTRPTAYAA
jgi:hypothetical protein